eukprot:tig00021358_g20810.t1
MQRRLAPLLTRRLAPDCPVVDAPSSRPAGPVTDALPSRPTGSVADAPSPRPTGPIANAPPPNPRPTDHGDAVQSGGPDSGRETEATTDSLAMVPIAPVQTVPITPTQPSASDIAHFVRDVNATTATQPVTSAAERTAPVPVAIPVAEPASPSPSSTHATGPSSPAPSDLSTEMETGSRTAAESRVPIRCAQPRRGVTAGSIRDLINAGLRRHDHTRMSAALAPVTSKKTPLFTRNFGRMHRPRPNAINPVARVAVTRSLTFAAAPSAKSTNSDADSVREPKTRTYCALGTPTSQQEGNVSKGSGRPTPNYKAPPAKMPEIDSLPAVEGCESLMLTTYLEPKGPGVCWARVRNAIDAEGDSEEARAHRFPKPHDNMYPVFTQASNYRTAVFTEDAHMPRRRDLSFANETCADCHPMSSAARRMPTFMRPNRRTAAVNYVESTLRTYLRGYDVESTILLLVYILEREVSYDANRPADHAHSTAPAVLRPKASEDRADNDPINRNRKLREMLMDIAEDSITLIARRHQAAGRYEREGGDRVFASRTVEKIMHRPRWLTRHREPRLRASVISIAHRYYEYIDSTTGNTVTMTNVELQEHCRLCTTPPYMEFVRNCPVPSPTSRQRTPYPSTLRPDDAPADITLDALYGVTMEMKTLFLRIIGLLMDITPQGTTSLTGNDDWPRVADIFLNVDVSPFTPAPDPGNPHYHDDDMTCPTAPVTPPTDAPEPPAPRNDHPLRPR